VNQLVFCEPNTVTGSRRCLLQNVIAILGHTSSSGCAFPAAQSRLYIEGQVILRQRTRFASTGSVHFCYGLLQQLCSSEVAPCHVTADTICRYSRRAKKKKLRWNGCSRQGITRKLPCKAVVFSTPTEACLAVFTFRYKNGSAKSDRMCTEAVLWSAGPTSLELINLCLLHLTLSSIRGAEKELLGHSQIPPSKS
jgi:hypothetical protein